MMSSKKSNIISMSPAQLQQLFPDLREDIDEMNSADHVEARIIAKGNEEIDLEKREKKTSFLIMPYFVFEYGKARSPEISSFSVKQQMWVYAKRWGAHSLIKKINLDRHYTVAHITLVDPLETVDPQEA